MSETYDKDFKKNEIVAAWLDKYFYSEVKKYKNQFIRYDDRPSQDRGIDTVVITNTGKKYIIDEKSSTYHTVVNDDFSKRLDTFAFEIGYIHGGYKPGWAVRTDKYQDTNFYLINWLRTKQRNIKSIADIEAVYSCLIEKKEIHELIVQIMQEVSNELKIFFEISDLNTSSQVIYDYLTQLRFPNPLLKDRTTIFNGQKVTYRFSYSPNLEEKPLNILLYRNASKKWNGHQEEFLKMISTRQYLTTTKEFKFGKSLDVPEDYI